MVADARRASGERRPRGRPKRDLRWSEGVPDRDEQYRRRREALLRTAARAFNETSYYSTSVDELARRLNVTKPTLYHYIKDKDDILYACNNMAYELIRDALEEAARGHGTGMEKLVRFMPRFAELMASDFGACLVRTGLRPLKPESRAVLQKFAKQLESTMRGIIRQGIDDGSIRPCDPKLAAYAILGGYNSIAHWYRRAEATSSKR
jgi:AcrR family transcriptional regulator